MSVQLGGHSQEQQRHRQASIEAHIFKATIVNFGVRVRTWNTLPVPNFVQIAQGDLSFRGKFLLKIRHFRDFELLKPTFLYV